MSDNQIEKTREYAAKYNKKMRLALEAKYTRLQFPPQGIELILAQTDHSLEFIDLYLKSEYPKDRLSKLTDGFLDIQFQITMLKECHVGLYNSLVHLPQGESQIAKTCPYLFLRQLSLDQGSIFQSRALWEKLMNFIYFLEEGLELETKKSKKTKFFDWVSENPKWNFLNRYEHWIQKLDNIYRTPEAHKNSRLRKHFIEGSSPFPEDMLHTLNIIMNTFWPNLKNMLQRVVSPIVYVENQR
ncbi:MAG: hypothetical protein WC222_01540 [Parachlamydiales bacterium]|jgi:hypothetical protein